MTEATTDSSDAPPVDLAHLLISEHGNTLAKHPAVRPIVRQWVEETCPLIYVWAPSSTGKTTLGGTLMKHPDYRPTLLIGIESGDSTIGEWTGNDSTCIRNVFEGEPSQQRAWIYSQLDAAADVDCKSILIEGLASWHILARSRALRSAPNATGHALQRLCIEPSMRTSSVIGAIYDLKMTRRARKRPCPIIVTLNTKEVGADENKSLMPGFSNNLVEQARQNAEAFIELQRSPSGVSMLAQADLKKHKLRHALAAQAIESQIDLTLPGMLALWALTIHVKADVLSRQLTGH
jgi:hypothetical protein